MVQRQACVGRGLGLGGYRGWLHCVADLNVGKIYVGQHILIYKVYTPNRSLECGLTLQHLVRSAFSLSILWLGPSFPLLLPATSILLFISSACGPYYSSPDWSLLTKTYKYASGCHRIMSEIQKKKHLSFVGIYQLRLLLNSSHLLANYFAKGCVQVFKIIIIKHK